MLTLHIEATSMYDEKTEKFIEAKEQTIVLEHSLVSISKWESKYHKPFISKDEKSAEELKYYIKCMTLTQNVPDITYSALKKEHYKKINDYIDDSMTATTFTTFKKQDEVSKQSIITSELIYYWMVSYQIPLEAQKWHLNRLLTLIRICNIKNNSNNKMSKKDLYANNKALNAARRAKLHSRG